MLKKTLFLFLLGAASIGSTYAQNSMVHDAKTNCEKIMKYKEASQNSAEPFYKKLMALFEQSSSKLVTKRLASESEYYIDKEELKNYVFLYKPLEKEEVLDRHRADYNNIIEKVSIHDHNLKILVETETIQQCEDLYDQFPVDENYYNELHKSIEENTIASDTIGSESVLNDILELEKKKKLINSWTVLYQTELNYLQRILNSPDTGSVVVVAHASDRGQLFDSKGHGIPKEVFKTLSPSIHGLSIFSCFGEKVFNFYGLGNGTNKRVSAYKHLNLSYVETNRSDDKISIDQFKKFFKKVDFRDANKLVRLRFNSNQRNIHIKKCELKINTSNKTADYFVILNNYFVANPSYKNDVYEFPCDYLSKKEGDNTIRVYKGSRSEFSQDRFFIEIEKPVEEEYFYNAEGRFQGAYIKF